MSTSMAPPHVAGYVAALVHESAQQKALRAETSKMPNANMQLSVDAAATLRWLVTLIGARRTLEIGTFTGYSTLTVAEALPADGTIIACDLSDYWTNVGRRAWKAAGVDGKIDLRIAPAVTTLDALIAEGQSGTFDLAFIDADKPSYDAYYERCLKLVRPNGVLVFDNMLWSGAVAEAGEKDADTAALDALNKKVCSDARVEAVLLTVADGLLVARRR